MRAPATPVQRGLSYLTKWLFAYLLVLAVVAVLAGWTPEYLHGRTWWHFMATRMIVPMVMVAALASFIRLVPAAVLTAAGLLAVGMASAIKQAATGEPFQVSDFLLAGQGTHLTSYVAWWQWLVAALFIPALVHAVLRLRLRWWSLPAFALCAGLLSSYRLEPVARWIHDNSWWIGVENLTFSQAESARMNGLATHLYFSTAGLRLKTYAPAEVAAAMAALDVAPAPAPRRQPLPDIYVVLGEAWWRDPSDMASPLDLLSGMAEGTMISPVYGGTTPNAEFEVLTAVPVYQFQAGIIPFQHYVGYFSDDMRSLPHLLAGLGYEAHAYHNFTPRFWLRDQVYPKMGFASFDSMEQMTLTMQPNGWPTDRGLYDRVLTRSAATTTPQMHFIVTVETHGPYQADAEHDLIHDVSHPGITDYHRRLASAVTAFRDFDAALRARGRPYVLVAFGDHLPGTRNHQWKMGYRKETDVRLHQVPLIVSSNGDDAAAVRDRLMGRPLHCLTPVLADWLRIDVRNRYFSHVVKRCDGAADPALKPAEAVIQNQLFTTAAQP
ncbi:MAG TPA: LTA synthase family protein [Aestuariivirga sp.]|nr:LTA synthase family protein [Aestuariivirga sp.]